LTSTAITIQQAARKLIFRAVFLLLIEEGFSKAILLNAGWLFGVRSKQAFRSIENKKGEPRTALPVKFSG